MKKTSTPTVYTLVLALLMSMTLGSCGLVNKFRGDPRKNCNHPKHHEWVKEQRTKRLKSRGLDLPEPEQEDEAPAPGGND